MITAAGTLASGGSVMETKFPVCPMFMCTNSAVSVFAFLLVGRQLSYIIPASNCGVTAC